MKSKSTIHKNDLGPSRMYSVRLPEEIIKLLKKVADLKKISASAVIREAIQNIAKQS